MNFKLKPGANGPGMSKILLVMKLIAVILCIALTQVHARGFAQNITIHEKNVTIEKVLLQIEQKSKYHFIYESDLGLIKTKVINVDADNLNVDQILDQCLAGQPVSYTIIHQTIALKSAEKTISGDKQVQPPVKITGVVVDEKGDPLPGVTVKLRGTSTGVVTNTQGVFTINIPDGKGTLEFSFIGYETQAVDIGGQSQINIKLKQAFSKLNEIVVVGYGTQSRKLLSTSISKIDGENIGIQPVGTMSETLGALAPGVEVQADRGGTPGAASTIKIRGGGSLGTSNDPLYVVDGYPLQESSQFNLINPSDIASIEILKDAASAAIYGSRAANGVVIVTTKRGKAGKTAFSFSASSGIQQLSKKVDVLDRDQYIDEVQYEIRTRNYPSAPSAIPAAFLKPDSLPNTDWQDVAYRIAKINNYQLSASGGSDKTRYAVSLGYFQQDGIMLGTDFNRFNMRMNLDVDLTSKLKLSVSLAPSYTVQDKQAAAGQFTGSNNSENGGTRSVPSAGAAALLLPPTLPVYNPNGEFGQYFNNPITNWYQGSLYNPLSILTENQNKIKSFRMLGNMFLEYELLPGLKLKSSIGSTLNMDQQHAYIPATMPSGNAPTASYSNPVIASIFARESQIIGIDYLWENTITYNKSIGDHTFSVLGLYSMQKFQSQSLATSGQAGTFTNTILNNPLASPSRLGELGYDQNAFLSYAGRVTYDYKKKYILSAAIRSDASSRFGQNNRFGTFPSASGAWRISEESFWKNIRPVVNEFKLRVTYGETGNANIGSFTYLNNVTGRNYSFGGTRQFGYALSGFANPNLTWEKNRQADYGTDISFLNDKFFLSFDYYDRLTKGMLLQRDLPGIVGYATNYYTNVGSMQNRGLELSLGTKLKINKFQWNITGNISGNRTKILDLGGPLSFPATAAINGWNNVFQVKVGDPLGNMYGFKVIGFFKNAADLANNAKYTAGDKIGDWMIQDQNGDGKIDENDRVKVGKGVPDFTYGLTQNFTWKGFDATLIMQGVYGGNILMGNLRQFYAGTQFNTLQLLYHNTFDPANPDDPKYWPVIGANGVNPLNNLTDRQVYSASFLRVRNLTFGYTFRPAFLQRIKVTGLRVFVTGQNLFTFTSYPGYTPETSVNPGSLTQPGVDQGTYPGIRVYTAGLNMNF